MALLLEHIPYCITLRQAVQRQMTFCAAPAGYRLPTTPSGLGLVRASLPSAWRFNSNNSSHKSSTTRSSHQERLRLRHSSSRCEGPQQPQCPAPAAAGSQGLWNA